MATSWNPNNTEPSLDAIDRFHENRRHGDRADGVWVEARHLRTISHEAMASKQVREAYRPTVGSCVRIKEEGNMYEGLTGQIIGDDRRSPAPFTIRDWNGKTFELEGARGLPADFSADQASIEVILPRDMAQSQADRSADKLAHVHPRRPTRGAKVQIVGYSPWMQVLRGQLPGRVGEITADDMDQRPATVSSSDGTYTVGFGWRAFALERISTSRVQVILEADFKLHRNWEWFFMGWACVYTVLTVSVFVLEEIAEKQEAQSTQNRLKPPESSSLAGCGYSASLTTAPLLWLINTCIGTVLIMSSAWHNVPRQETTAAISALLNSPRAVPFLTLTSLLLDQWLFRSLLSNECFSCTPDVVQLAWLFNYALIIGFTLSQMINVFRMGTEIEHESIRESGTDLPTHLVVVKFVRERLLHLIPVVLLLFMIGARKLVGNESAPFIAISGTLLLATFALTVVLYLETEMREELVEQGRRGSRMLLLESTDPDPDRPVFVKFKYSPVYQVHDKLIEFCFARHIYDRYTELPDESHMSDEQRRKWEHIKYIWDSLPRADTGLVWKSFSGGAPTGGIDISDPLSTEAASGDKSQTLSQLLTARTELTPEELAAVTEALQVKALCTDHYIRTDSGEYYRPMLGKPDESKMNDEEKDKWGRIKHAWAWDELLDKETLKTDRWEGVKDAWNPWRGEDELSEPQRREWERLQHAWGYLGPRSWVLPTLNATPILAAIYSDILVFSQVPLSPTIPWSHVRVPVVPLFRWAFPRISFCIPIWFELPDLLAWAREIFVIVLLQLEFLPCAPAALSNIEAVACPARYKCPAQLLASR